MLIYGSFMLVVLKNFKDAFLATSVDTLVLFLIANFIHAGILLFLGSESYLLSAKIIKDLVEVARMP